MKVTYSFFLIVCTLIIRDIHSCATQDTPFKSKPNNPVGLIVKLLKTQSRSDQPIYLFGLQLKTHDPHPAKMREILAHHPKAKANIVKRFNIQDADAPCWSEWANTHINNCLAGFCARILRNHDEQTNNSALSDPQHQSMSDNEKEPTQYNKPIDPNEGWDLAGKEE